MNRSWRLKRGQFAQDSGVTLVELMIALIISGLLAIGVVQISHLGIGSLLYAGDKSLQTHSQSTVTRNFTADVAASNGLIISASTVPSSASNLCTTWVASDTTFANTKPLLTITSVSGSSYIGYEVRLDSASKVGQLWRVKCTTTGTLSNPKGSLLLRTGLPVPSDSSWTNSMVCTGQLSTSGSITTSSCPSNSFLITTLGTFVTTLSADATAGVNSLTLTDVSGITAGMSLSGSGTASGTTVTGVDLTAQSVTLSKSTTGAMLTGSQVILGGNYVGVGTAANGSTALTVTDASNLQAGMWVSCPDGTASCGIPLGTTVLSISGLNLVLSKSTTTALSATSLSFTTPSGIQFVIPATTTTPIINSQTIIAARSAA